MLLLCLFGCKDESEPQARSDPARATAAPSSSASAASTAPAAPPTLALVRAFAELPTPAAVYAVEGALLISARHRVGKVRDGGVEWIGEVPAERPGFGQSIIELVAGSYPDAVDVVFFTDNGRVPAPTYLPLTGKGHSSVFAAGGGLGVVSGIARVGDSTLVAGFDIFDGYRIVTVRGPRVERRQTTPQQAGCPPADHPVYYPVPAVRPYAFGSAADGTLFAVGSFCGEQGAAVEIWDDKSGKPRIVSLDPWIKSVGYNTAVLRGPNNLVWIAPDAEGPILAWRGGELEPLPKLAGRTNTFTARDGTLFASDGKTIHRFDGTAWMVAAQLQWPTPFRRLVVHDGAYWASVGEGIYRLEPGASVAARDDCKKPFVYLYDVSPKSEKSYTFPTTRKALSSFDRVGDLGLVDFHEGVRRLGLTVPSAKVGRAVIAHVKANMKDEHPVLVCYRPEKSRRIDIATGRTLE